MAEAERRLLFLQERARQRRRDKRELAALHQALADQEAMKTKDGGKGDKDGAERERGARRGGVSGIVDTVVRADGDGGYCLNDAAHSDVLKEREAPSALPSLELSDNQSARRLTAALLNSASVDAGGKEVVAAAAHSTEPTGSGYIAPADTPPTLDTIEHDLAPTISDTSSRRALLVRMGLVRARLDSGGGEDEGQRPVAESLLREVEELSKSGAVGGVVGRRTES